MPLPPSSVDEWFKTLTGEQQWAHCGKRTPHDPHTHSFAMNEGPYTDVPCIGVPAIYGNAVPPPPQPPSLPPSPYARRPSWEEVWAHVTEAVSARSLCVRAKVGAVIVDSTNRIIATGYNGPPAGFEHRSMMCTHWCVRAAWSAWLQAPGAPDMPDFIPADYEGPRADYDDCPSLHAEANALMAADRSTWQDGTIYVLGDVCMNCAKLIANSGLSTVIVRRDGQSRDYRLPERSYEFLERCGMTVVIE